VWLIIVTIVIKSEDRFRAIQNTALKYGVHLNFSNSLVSGLITP